MGLDWKGSIQLNENTHTKTYISTWRSQQQQDRNLSTTFTNNADNTCVHDTEEIPSLNQGKSYVISVDLQSRGTTKLLIVSYAGIPEVG